MPTPNIFSAIDEELYPKKRKAVRRVNVSELLEKMVADQRRETAEKLLKTKPHIVQTIPVEDADHATQDEIVTILRQMFQIAQRNSKTRKIPFDLTIDDLVRAANRCKWRCSITGIPFDHNQREGWTRRPYAASIDRINSASGYTARMCAWYALLL